MKSKNYSKQLAELFGEAAVALPIIRLLA